MIEKNDDGIKETPDDKIATAPNSNVEDDASLEDDGPVPGEILEKLPGPMRESIRQTIGFMAHGPIQNPIAKKITPEHISQIIALQDKEIDREYRFQLL